MKKFLALTLFIMSFSGSAFAATLASNGVSAAGVGIYGGKTQSGTTDGADVATSPLAKLSTGVRAVVNFDGTGASYAIATKHSKGSKIIGTANDSTNMYFLAVPQGDITGATVGTASTNANFSSWTSM